MRCDEYAAHTAKVSYGSFGGTAKHAMSARNRGALGAAKQIDHALLLGFSRGCGRPGLGRRLDLAGRLPLA